MDLALVRSHRVGTVKSIPVYVTPIWVIIFFFAVLSFAHIDNLLYTLSPVIEHLPFEINQPLIQSAPLQIVFGFALASALYASILAHEYGHAYVAQKNGLNVKEFKLWFLGGIAKIEIESNGAKRELKTAAGGPAVSLIIATVCLGILYLLFIANMFPDSVTVFFFLLTLINSSILIFNLIPALPLDGGRILRASLQQLFGYERSTQYTGVVGQAIAVAMITTTLLFPQLWILTFIAIFIFFTSMRQKEQSEQHTLDNHALDNAIIAVSPVALSSNPKIIEQMQKENASVTTDITRSVDYIVIQDDEQKKFYNTINTENDTTILTVKEISKMIDQPMDESKSTANK